MSLILFIDFPAFSSTFSSTFGRTKYNESTQSIKERHSKFVHIAKYLREIVQYFGIDTGHFSIKSCPFYIATTTVFKVPSFVIRLHKPISVTKDIEIAKQLSTSNGMIIQINNASFQAQNGHFFDCLWINNNPIYNQRIFYGRRYIIGNGKQLLL